MLILDTVIIMLQIIVAWRVVRSPVWASSRHCTECVKVLYASVVMAAILTCGAVLITRYTEIAACVPIYAKAAIFTLLLMYSFVSYHAVSILNVSRIKKRNIEYAPTRSRTA